MDFAAWLKERGFVLDDLSEEQKTSLQAMFDADQALAGESDDDDTKGKTDPDPNKIKAGAGTGTDLGDDPDADLKARRKRHADETRRLGKIQEICGGKHSDIEAKAIEEGWSIEKVELEVMRADRSKGPAIHAAKRDLGPSVIEAAMSTALHVEKVEEQYDEKTLEAAHQRFRHGIGLQEVILLAAQANGYEGRAYRITAGNLREILAAAFPLQIQAAGFSTFSLSGTLANVANKLLLDSFNAVESAWRQIALIGQVGDFKTHYRYRLTGDLQYDQLGAAGEIKHATLDELEYTVKADTYAKMLAVTRQDIINDDLGALKQIPQRLGRGAALKINDVFWTEFLDNSSFFAAGNSNYITGVAYVLASAGLKKALETFRKLTDPDGKPMGHQPKLLLVPPEVEETADELFVSTNIVIAGSTDQKKPSANVYRNKYKPVMSTYLSNSSYTGYSTTAWYLLADPRDVAVIEIAFLNGQESPTIESADTDFNTLGIQYRGYHDFGCSKQECRGGVKMKGAN